MRGVGVSVGCGEVLGVVQQGFVVEGFVFGEVK